MNRWKMTDVDGFAVFSAKERPSGFGETDFPLCKKFIRALKENGRNRAISCLDEKLGARCKTFRPAYSTVSAKDDDWLALRVKANAPDSKERTRHQRIFGNSRDSHRRQVSIHKRPRP